MQAHTQVTETPAESYSAGSTAVAGSATGHALTNADDPYARRRANTARVVQAIYPVRGLIGALLLVSFFLRALAAHADASFTRAILPGHRQQTDAGGLMRCLA